MARLPVPIPMSEETANWILRTPTQITRISYQANWELKPINLMLGWPLSVFKMYEDRYDRIHLLVRNHAYQVEAFTREYNPTHTVMEGNLFLIHKVSFETTHRKYVIYHTWSIKPLNRVGKKG